MRSFLFGTVLGAFGVVWWFGALPTSVEDFLNRHAGDLASKVGIEVGSETPESESVSSEKPAAPASASSSGSGSSGGGSVFETADALRRGGVFKDGHLIDIYNCPGMTVSNKSFAVSSGRIMNFKPLINVQGITLSVAPVSHACLSSGFGTRDGKAHKGVDYHSEQSSQVYAAGAGTIVEALYRHDYGNMVVIDHGNGVYTRYAHLGSLASGIKAGKSVSGTTKLGPMGKTASYRIPQHLHFELLIGDYDTPAKSFGLAPKDPFSY